MAAYILSFIFSVLFLSNLWAQTAHVVEPPQDLFTVEVKLKIDPTQKERARDLLRMEAVKDILSKFMKSKNLNEETFWQHFILTPQGKELSSFMEVVSSTPVSRAANEPDLYFSSSTVRLDTVAFMKVYTESSTEKNQELPFVLRIDYDLTGVTWQELGVTYKEDFTKVVEESWLKWLIELDPRLKNIQVVTTSPADGHELFIKMRIEKRGGLNPLTPGITLHYSGGVFMKNLHSGNIIFSQKFDESDEFYAEDLRKSFSSAIANHVYRLPLSPLSKVKAQNIGVKQELNKDVLTLTHFHTSEQVFHFIDLLKEKGSALSLSTQLKGLGNQKALIEVQYMGSTDDLKKFLASQDFTGVKKGHGVLEFVSLPLNTPKDIHSKVNNSKPNPLMKEEVSP